MKRKTHKIVFASVLKPSTDIRMYGKLAAAIASSFEGIIYMLGHKSLQSPANHHKYIFKDIFSFHRTAWRRCFTEFIFLYHLLSIRPQKVVVTTYELLYACVLYKWLTGALVYYDVQENYALNIQTGSLPLIVRMCLARYVRSKERILAPWIDGFLLAESCYLHELPFVHRRATVIANKVDKSILQHQKNKLERLHICITGTLGKTYGTLQAIEALKGVYAVYPKIEVTIIGYCVDQTYLKLLQKATENQHFIKTIGGATLVDYKHIWDVIAESHVCLMFYESNESFANKIPTKFYECIALQTQIIASPNKVWTSFLTGYDAGTTLVPQLTSTVELLHILLQLKDKPCRIDEHLFFDLEKIKLQNVLLSTKK